MSASEVHAGVKRAVAARLMDMQRKIPVKSNLLEFLIHGVKYAFPPDRGGLTRGMPTGYAAPPLKALIMQPDEPPPVWPDPEGTVRRGISEFHLQRRHPPLITRTPTEHQEVAHPLGGKPKRTQIAAVQTPHGVITPQPLQ